MSKNRKTPEWYDAKFLSALRSQIVLGSLFTSDYANTLGVDENECCAFFDGYMSFLDEDDEKDCTENLVRWAMCFEETPFPSMGRGANRNSSL